MFFVIIDIFYLSLTVTLSSSNSRSPNYIPPLFSASSSYFTSALVHIYRIDMLFEAELTALNIATLSICIYFERHVVLFVKLEPGKVLRLSIPALRAALFKSP